MNRRTLAVGVLLLLLTGACSTGSGKPAQARLIRLTVTDALRFEPATVTARAGEKVRFEITNTGGVNHEFAIGSASFQERHAARIASGSPGPPDHGGGHGGGHGAGGAAVDVPAGRTATVDYTMPAEPPVFACHLNAHDQAGMRGAVTYG